METQFVKITFSSIFSSISISCSIKTFGNSTYVSWTTDEPQETDAFIPGLPTAQWFSFTQKKVSPHAAVSSIPFSQSVFNHMRYFLLCPSIHPSSFGYEKILMRLNHYRLLPNYWIPSTHYLIQIRIYYPRKPEGITHRPSCSKIW